MYIRVDLSAQTKTNTTNLDMDSFFTSLPTLRQLGLLIDTADPVYTHTHNVRGCSCPREIFALLQCYAA
jgi:hypothetical protein